LTGISPSSRRRGDCIKLVRISVPPRSKNAQFAVGQPPSPTPSPEEWFFDAVLSFDSLKGWGWGRLDLSQPHLRRQARHTYTLCKAAVRTLPDPVPAHRQGVQVDWGKGDYPLLPPAYRDGHHPQTPWPYDCAACGAAGTSGVGPTSQASAAEWEGMDPT